MRVLGGSVLIAGVLLLLSPAAAIADEPVDLAGAYVLDRAGVVDDPGAVRDAIDALYDERGTQLFVVYVDRFEGAASDQDWANETAERSGLGDSDVLFAIATEDRVARWSVTDSFPLSDAQLQSIFDDRVVPELRGGDWGGGAIAFAQGLSDAQAPSPVLPIAVGVVGGGAVVAGAVVALRRRGARRRAEAEVRKAAEDLERRAGAVLVELDDALKTSEQELGFAQAQFGEAVTREFQTALEQARATAQQAFQIRQQLDDAFPETPEERRTLTMRLIELAEEADATLDAQADAFDELRALEKNAPVVLEQVEAELAGLPEQIDAAEARVAELGRTHPDADLTPVRGIPAQARRLRGFAETAVADARAELAQTDGEAAVAVRAAQQAVGQITRLLAGVEPFAAELAQAAEVSRRAAQEAGAAVQVATAAVRAAQEYITANRGAIGATARTRISEAERHLTAATAAGLAATTALDEAREAERLAGHALSAARIDVEAYEEQAAIREHGRSGPDDYRYQADGASLGGILADLFFGEGSAGSRDRDGGWFWGGGSSSGGGWSSSRPSGFGGSSRRTSSSSRRSSGSSSRRSSGGRRGGGGRF